MYQGITRHLQKSFLPKLVRAAFQELTVNLLITTATNPHVVCESFATHRQALVQRVGHHFPGTSPELFQSPRIPQGRLDVLDRRDGAVVARDLPVSLSECSEELESFLHGPHLISIQPHRAPSQQVSQELKRGSV